MYFQNIYLTQATRRNMIILNAFSELSKHFPFVQDQMHAWSIN